MIINHLIVFMIIKLMLIKHPHIELGSRIFIPDLDMTYIVLGPGKWVPLGEENNSGEDPNEPTAAISSTLGEAVLGNMILGG